MEGGDGSGATTSLYVKMAAPDPSSNDRLKRLPWFLCGEKSLVPVAYVRAVGGGRGGGGGAFLRPL